MQKNSLEEKGLIVSAFGNYMKKSKKQIKPDPNETPPKKTNQQTKGCFENLSQFFENIRLANAYETNKKIKKIKTELEKFFDSTLEDIILDDRLIPKNVQKQKLNKFHSLKDKFYIALEYPWTFNKKRVVVAGRFSAGKSSVINKLLKQNILPTDVNPTTAIPTQITSLPLKKQSVIKTINYERPKVIRTESLKKLVKEEIKNFPIHIADIIEYIVINNNTFDDDIVIIDTPGFDPSDKKGMDKDMTLMQQTFNKADIIIWVMDIEDGDIGASALKVLQTIKDKKKIIIINKCDQKVLAEEILDVVMQVRQTLQKNGISYERVITLGDKEKMFIQNKKEKRNLFWYYIEKISSLFKNFDWEYEEEDVIEEMLDFSKNITYLKKTIQNTPIKEVNIFKEIKSFLDGLYNDLVALENSINQDLSTFERLQYIWQNEDKVERLKQELHKHSNLSQNWKDVISAIDNLIDTIQKNQEELYIAFETVNTMWKMESPLFGEDKLYIEYERKDEFNSIIEKMLNFEFNVGYYNGLIYSILDNQISNLKDTKEIFDRYISQILNAKKDIEEIELLYKQYY